MKKLIIFMLAAVLVSCSQQKKMIEEDRKLNKQYEIEKKSKYYKVTRSYERFLDTIKVSDEYVIVAVYTSTHSISTVIIGKPTKLD